MPAHSCLYITTVKYNNSKDSGESHGERSLAVYSPWGRRESDITEEIQHAHAIINNPSFTKRAEEAVTYTLAL